MIRTQIYIPEDIHNNIWMLARKKNEPFAKILRDFIEKGLQEEKTKIKQKKLTTLARLNITGGPKDLSKNMDKYLYGK